MEKLNDKKNVSDNAEKELRISDVSGSYTSGEIIAAWSRCKENRGLGYVVTLQDLLSELSNYR